jgi:hypothetical protein
VSAIPGATATFPGEAPSGHAGGVTVIPPPAGLFQPIDSDLTAIAALTTTAYGRSLLALADAAANRTALGLGTAATTNSTAYDAAGLAAAAQAASQPLDSDLTAIAALTTTTFGRALLALANPADATKFLNGTGAFTVPAGGGSGVSTGVFNVKDPTYGAVGDGSTNDTTALQNAINAAWAAPGGTVYLPFGVYKITAALTVPSGSGELHIRGSGRSRSFTGGVDGDPAAGQGSVIRQTSTTADALFFTPGASGRQLITIEQLAIEGNPAGTTGHGIHFQAASTAAILPDLRDVTVQSAKQHGIFYDGAVFESDWFNVRVNSCGGSGFKADTYSSGLPGEVRLFGCVFNLNNVGIDIAGGGQFTFYGTTSGYNVHEAFIAVGVYLYVHDLNCEANSQAFLSGTIVRVQSCSQAIIDGLAIGAPNSGTGIGLSFIGCSGAIVRGFNGASSASAGGYLDFNFDDNCHYITMDTYKSNDATDRYALGQGGGHLIRTGGVVSGVTHKRQQIDSGTTSSATFDMTRYSSFVSKRTASAITVTIARPGFEYNDTGKRFVFTVWNASAGATTTTWAAQFHLAGAWTDPAAGKSRAITFEWDEARDAFIEVGRSAADIT